MLLKFLICAKLPCALKHVSGSLGKIENRTEISGNRTEISGNRNFGYYSFLQAFGNYYEKPKFKKNEKTEPKFQI